MKEDVAICEITASMPHGFSFREFTEGREETVFKAVRNARANPMQIAEYVRYIV